VLLSPSQKYSPAAIDQATAAIVMRCLTQQETGPSEASRARAAILRYNKSRYVGGAAANCLPCEHGHDSSWWFSHARLSAHAP
jgi:hypothetical protein